MKLPAPREFGPARGRRHAMLLGERREALAAPHHRLVGEHDDALAACPQDRLERLVQLGVAAHRQVGDVQAERRGGGLRCGELAALAGMAGIGDERHPAHPAPPRPGLPGNDRSTSR
jgi:hypothetical protein